MGGDGRLDRKVVPSMREVSPVMVVRYLLPLAKGYSFFRGGTGRCVDRPDTSGLGVAGVARIPSAEIGIVSGRHVRIVQELARLGHRCAGYTANLADESAV
jgi:hypothetical protein